MLWPGSSQTTRLVTAADARELAKAIHMAGARLSIHEHWIIGARQPPPQLPTRKLLLRNAPEGIHRRGYRAYFGRLCKREGPMMEERVEPLQEQKLRGRCAQQRAPTNEQRPMRGVSARVRDSKQIASENVSVSRRSGVLRLRIEESVSISRALMAVGFLVPGFARGCG